MAEPVHIKRSPIVLIRMLAAIEALAFVAYFLAASLGNSKYEFYRELFIADLISYQALKFLVLSGVQFTITIYAFLRWYYDIYTIEPRMISHESGVFFKKNEKVPLKNAMSVTLASGPVGKRLHYGSIHLNRSGSERLLALRDISYPERYAGMISDYVGNQRPDDEPRRGPDIRILLSQEESEKLEFKASLRYDYRKGNANAELERAALKTIAAFLNGRGGHLVIGVGDNREILGLANDYFTLKRPSNDGFEQHMTQLFNKMIGPEFREFVRLWFIDADNNIVCVVQVEPSIRPVYLKADDTEHFYVRTGNLTVPLKLSEIEAYSRTRWRGTGVTV